jgi:carboxypeptidase PM20D1
VQSGGSATGTVIAGGTLWGVDLPVGLVGVGEKGMLTLRLTVDTQPGHSSMPPRSTAIGILSRAIQRLEQNPMPAQLRHLRDLYRSLGAAASFGAQLMFANLWLFGGAVKRRLDDMPEANALARTTSAVTMVSGGIKENVLPQRAEALVSMRLLPGDSVQKVCAHARRVITDPRVQLEAVAAGTWEASPISDTSSPEYESLRDTIRRVFGGVAVAPFLAVGATDSRRFTALCPNVFRFSPYILDKNDIRSIHGANEHISLDTLARMVQFYVELLRTWG